ncbi:uncharacterized protein LOC143459745 isoform X2 [Clavelina lepadiformis]|uniref:uncharacterized protein LOC143459745 isoform X2 n=1 Tax=Clavelina lepadiformis TaxID=159417 RepID=UPI004042842A
MRLKTNRQIVHFNQLKHSAGDFSRSCHSGEASLLEREENQQTQPTSYAMMQPDITELPHALTATLHGITETSFQAALIKFTASNTVIDRATSVAVMFSSASIVSTSFYKPGSFLFALKQHGFADFPMTNSHSLSEPSIFTMLSNFQQHQNLVLFLTMLTLRSD